MASLNLFKTLTIFNACLGLPSTLGTTEQRLIANVTTRLYSGPTDSIATFTLDRGEGTDSITSSLQSSDHN